MKFHFADCRRRVACNNGVKAAANMHGHQRQTAKRSTDGTLNGRPYGTALEKKKAIAMKWDEQSALKSCKFEL